nr:Uncharacterised protein [Klebsiella pneumoniae]
MAAKTRADRLAVLSGAGGDESGDAPGVVVDEPPRLAAGCPDGRVVFLAANLASAVVTQYETLLAARFIASLAGGTLMILCISCAAGTPNPSRVYAFWVLGQLLLGMLGLLALPGLFATFGLKVVYLILAAIMLCCLPLVSAFLRAFNRFQSPASSRRRRCGVRRWRCWRCSLSISASVPCGPLSAPSAARRG